MPIRITQPDGVGDSGADGNALGGAWLDAPVLFTFDFVAGATYSHELKYRPADSTAALTGAATQQATLVPDVRGTYRVESRKTTPAGALEVVIRVVRVTKDDAGANEHMVAPAYLESGEETTGIDAYAPLWDRNIAEIESRLASGSGVPTMTTVAYSALPQAVTGRRRMVATATFGFVLVALALAGHALDGELQIDIPANTVDAQNKLVLPSKIDPDGSVVASFDPTKAFSLFILCTNGTGAGSFVASLKPTPGDAVLPTLSIVVDSDNPNALIVSSSEAIVFPSFAGLSLSGIAANLVAIEAVADEGQQYTIGTSASFAGTETAALVVGGDRTIQDLNGNLVATGSIPITFQGFDYNWANEAGASLWLEGDAGIGVADGASLASGWTGKNPPAAYVFSDATPPTFRSSGINTKPATEFDGIDDKLVSAAMTIANAFGASSNAWCVVAVFSVSAAADVASHTYQSPAIFSDPVGWLGLHIYRYTGDNHYYLTAYVYDTGVRIARIDLGLSLPVGGQIASMRLSGGNLVLGLNDVEPGGDATIACGPINAGANGNSLQIGKASSAHRFQGRIALLAIKQNAAYPQQAIDAYQSKYQ